MKIDMLREQRKIILIYTYKFLSQSRIVEKVPDSNHFDYNSAIAERIAQSSQTCVELRWRAEKVKNSASCNNSSELV